VQNTANAQVDLTALRHNLAVVRALCTHSRIMAMVKADAYGHGLLPVARALNAADGLAVARLQEALLLRKAGIAQRILLLGTLMDDADLALCSHENIDVCAHDNTSLASIVAREQQTPLRVWLKLDSGMHRLGLDPRAFVEADRLLSTKPGITEVIHMTHFSSADALTPTVLDQQLSCFAACHKCNPKAEVSLANSAALIARPETRTEWVRPGIMLYGDNPLGVRHHVVLRPAMTLRARVIAVRNIGIGESVGYNECWTSVRPSRIATVGIGYGDGYPRHAHNGTPVLINEHLASLVGTVSMDSLSVDITDCGRVTVGDEATMWGADLRVATIAKHSDSISYELFTSLGQRVSREYKNQA
jgi:alanine racemase